VNRMQPIAPEMGEGFPRRSRAFGASAGANARTILLATSKNPVLPEQARAAHLLRRNNTQMIQSNCTTTCPEAASLQPELAKINKSPRGKGATVGAGAVVATDVSTHNVVGGPTCSMEPTKILLAGCPTDVKTWTSLVNASPTPDVYFRPGYAAAYSGDHATALALVIKTSRRRFLLPLLLREITVVPLASSVEDYDAITPYGYGGVLPLDRGAVTSRDAAELLEQLSHWCIKSNVVSCMLRMHPLLAQHSGFSAGVVDCPGGAVSHFGPTAAIDLLAWDADLCAPAGMKKGRRSDLCHARRDLTVRLTSCESPQAAEMLQQFRSIYDQTMTRLNATPFYFFPDTYYLSLQQMLTSHVAVGVAYYRGQPVSAALFLADAQFGHYHLSGVTSEGKQHKAQTMVLVEGAQWMRHHGCRWFHLGGGRAPGDSLYSFKHSFGGRTFYHSNVTLIANRARYNELVKLRRTEKESAMDANDFFPAYRVAEQ